MTKKKPILINNQISEDSPNQVFCMAPFTHTYVSPQTERRICCASREEASFQKQYIDNSGPEGVSHYNPKTLEEHWNSEHMKSVRKRILAGEKIPECQVCNDEVLSLSSYRSWFNGLFADKLDEVFEKTSDDGHTEMKPISFDYRISNLCNFKCRMCGEQLSSSWESEKRKHNMWNPKTDPWMVPYNKRKILNFQQNVVEKELEDAVISGTVEELYWVGGEPLMWDLHWKLMKRLVDDGNSQKVYARYNTNLSRINWKGVELFDLLPNFKDYIMCCSIDGAGPIVEFIRSGLNWESWLDNFKKGCELNPDKMILDLTLTLPGLFCLKELYDISKELDVKIETKITFAFDPSVVMSPMCLPRHILNRLIDDSLDYMSDYTHKQQTLINTLHDMKSKRKTFEEEWPDTHHEALSRGKQYHLKVSEIRQKENLDRLSWQDVLKDKETLEWWNTI